MTDQGFLEGVFGQRQGPDGPQGAKGPQGDAGPPADQIWLPNPLYPNPGEPALLAGGPTDWYDPWAHNDNAIPGSTATPPASIGPRLVYRREGPIVKFRGAIGVDPGVSLPAPMFTLRPGFRPEGTLFAGLVLVSSTGAVDSGCHIDVHNGVVTRAYGATGSGRTVVGFEQIEFSVTRDPAKLRFLHPFPGSALGYARGLAVAAAPRRPSDLGLEPPPPLHAGMIDGEAR